MKTTKKEYNLNNRPNIFKNISIFLVFDQLKFIKTNNLSLCSQ